MVIFCIFLKVFINCSTYEKHDCYTVHMYTCISFADERGQFRYGGNAITVKVNTNL